MWNTARPAPVYESGATSQGEVRSWVMRLRLDDRHVGCADVVRTIEANGGEIETITPVPPAGEIQARDFFITSRTVRQSQHIVRSIWEIPGVEVIQTSDPTFHLHAGGKIEIRAKVPLITRDDLAMAYTPGFAHVAKVIARNPEEVYRFSIKRNAVAIVTDGSAVSGLGDVGPEAAIPVMEGKALLFKQFAGIDAFPICLGTKNVNEIVRIVKGIEPTFGGVMLEDIAAPRCFEIEDRLREELTIPVLHDDQHATAVAVTAALINAAKLVRKAPRDLKIVIIGAGAAGTASAKLFMQIGVQHIVACDRQGAIHRGRDDLNDAKRWFADHTNLRQEQGGLSRIIAGADVFLGLSGSGVITVEDVKMMAKDPIVFALANPNPEILPDEVGDLVAVIATGRSDYPNQIDGGLCYPGMFRGALDGRARGINDEMKLAAAYAIAEMVGPMTLSKGHIVPNIFDGVAPSVAKAVMQAAIDTGMARVPGPSPSAIEQLNRREAS